MGAAYDKYNYSKYWEGRTYEHMSEVSTFRYLLSKVSKVNNILEVGSGFGRLAPYYLHRAKKVYLSDPSARLLSEARLKLSQHKKINFVQSRLETLPTKLRGHKFDLVILVRVLHHLRDINHAFDSIDRLISPRGYLILEFANKIHLKEICRRFVRGDFTFLLDIFPRDMRSKLSQKHKDIPFFNFHPDTIKSILKAHKYAILDRKSVSNVRSEWLKKHLSLATLLWLDRILQGLFTYFDLGPSIFILARRLPS